MVLVLPALASACGGGPRPEQEPVPASFAVPGVTGRRCDHVGRRGEVPALTDLARAGTAGNIALWARGAADAPGDTVLLSLRYADDGRLDWVRVLSSTMAPVQTAELVHLLQESLVEDWRGGSGVQLRLVAGRLDAVLPSVVCDAYPLRRLPGIRLPMLTSREYVEYLENRGRRFDVLISLDEQGRVMDVQLPHPTGYHTIDQYLIEFPRDWEYAPRLHDGIPVSSTLRLSVRVGGH